MTLRWVDHKDGLSSSAYSGSTVVGMVVIRDDGLVAWSISAVSMKWVGKGSGETDTLAKGKRNLQRAWSTWLRQSGLAPIETVRHSPI